MNENCGPKDGYYLTPYSFTVFYHESSLLETVLAHIFPAVQPIPITAGMDWDDPAKLSAYPTREVIILNTTPTEKQLEKLFDNGTGMIHILVDKLQAAKVAYKNSNIAIFDNDKLYEHLPRTWFSQVLIIEYLLSAEYPDYVSQIDSVNQCTSKYFVKGLMTRKNIIDTIMDIISTPQCEDKVNELVTVGKTINEIKKAEITNIIDKSIRTEINGANVIVINTAYPEHISCEMLIAHFPANIVGAIIYGIVERNKWIVKLVAASSAQHSLVDIEHKLFDLPAHEGYVTTNKLFAVLPLLH